MGWAARATHATVGTLQCNLHVKSSVSFALTVQTPAHISHRALHATTSLMLFWMLPKSQCRIQVSKLQNGVLRKTCEKLFNLRPGGICWVSLHLLEGDVWRKTFWIWLTEKRKVWTFTWNCFSALSWKLVLAPRLTDSHLWSLFSALLYFFHVTSSAMSLPEKW